MDGVEVALPDGAQWMPGNGLGDKMGDGVGIGWVWR